MLTHEDLIERQGYCCASDVAPILGLSPYRTGWDVWLSKTRPPEPQTMKPEQALGHGLEPWLGDKWRESEPAKSRLWGEWERQTRGGWMACTPDAQACDVSDEFGLECKAMAYPLDGWGPTSSDEIPRAYRLQVEWSMMVTGFDRWDVAMVGMSRDVQAHCGRLPIDEAMAHLDSLLATNSRSVSLRFYTIKANPKLQKVIYTKCRSWWLNHIELGVPPDIDASKGCARAVKGDGATVGRIDDPGALEVLIDYANAKRALDSAQNEETAAKHRVQAYMGNHEEIADPRPNSLGRITWKRNKKGSRVWNLRGFNWGE